MAVDNRQIAEDVLAAVGGRENIVSATNCMTRLRLTLKDNGASVDDEAVKAIKGVLGVNRAGTQYQVIIGQNVTKVMAELSTMGIEGGTPVDEKLDDIDEKEPFTLKSVGSTIMNYLSKTMVAIIPLMMACAMFRTIASVMGPTMLNVWAADSEIYNLFNNWLYDAGFYFLPIILCMPVLAQVEKLFKKVLPDVLSTVFEPFLTMLVMVPIALCALAPLGSWLGDGIGNFMFALGNAGGIVTILAIGIIAASWEFLVMTGMHQVLITLGITALAQNGFDTCVFIGGMTASAACWGMGLGAFLRLKERDEKSTLLSFFISGLIGGITEPALYGCGFKYPRTFIGLAVGGFVGGIIAAIAGAKVYVIGNASVLSLIAAYAAGGTTNLMMGAGAGIIACLVTAAMVYFFGFTPEQLEEDAKAAQLG